MPPVSVVAHAVVVRVLKEAFIRLLSQVSRELQAEELYSRTSERKWARGSFASSQKETGTDPLSLCLLHVREGNFGQVLRSTSQPPRDFTIISQQNFSIRNEWGGTQCLFTDAEELWFLL